MKHALPALILTLCLAAGSALAGEIVVFSGGAMANPVKVAGADFTHTTGGQLRFVNGTNGAILGKVRAGEPADVIVVNNEGAGALQAEGLTAGPPVPIAKAIIGVAVKAGAAKPDISTPDKFKQAMLRASSITYPDSKTGAATGIYLVGLFERLGIGEAMAAKARPRISGAEAIDAVVAGQAEVVLTVTTELVTDRRLDFAGPLPEAIQNPMLFAAAVSRRAADPAGARAFIAFLISPGERAALNAVGAAPP